MNRTLNEVKESVTLVFRRSVGGRNRNRRRLRWEYTYHDWGIARRPVWNEIRREGGNEVKEEHRDQIIRSLTPIQSNRKSS